MFAQFMTWLRQKDRAEMYDGMDVHTCMLQQFGKSLHPDKRITGAAISFKVYSLTDRYFPEEEVFVMPQLDEYASDFGRAIVHENNVGKLLDRLSKLEALVV